jgi:hypothetical protein
VSLPGFVNGRDELIELVLPGCIEAIEKIFGGDYDVSRLSTYLRSDGRRLLENVSLILYDAAAQGHMTGSDGGLSVLLRKRLLDELERFGFDSKMIVAVFDRDEKESVRSVKALLEPFVVRYFRHVDGTAVTAAEADELIQGLFDKRLYQNAIREQGERIDQSLGKSKPLAKRAMLRMLGLYAPFSGLPFGGAPFFEFSIQLPGELLETNGTGTLGGRTRWKFSGEQLFPDGYEMKARSITIDRDGQTKVLGRVVIDDSEKALEFMSLTGSDGPLLEAVRAYRQTGDRSALVQFTGRTHEEIFRVKKIKAMLHKS